MKRLGEVWRTLAGGGPVLPAGAGAGLMLRAGRRGLEAAVAVPPLAAATFALRRGGELRPLETASRTTLGLPDLNLLEGGGECRWRRRGGGRGARSGVDFADAWRLEGAETAFLRTGAQAGELVLESRGVRLAPGSAYRFEVLAAVHRCRALVQLDLLGEGGEILHSLQQGISTSARGGRERAGYDPVAVTFEAAEGVATFRLRVRKGRALEGADSFVFAAEPRLTIAGEAVRSVSAWPGQAVDRFAAALRRGAACHLIELAPPAEASDDVVVLEVDGRPAAEALLPQSSLRAGTAPLTLCPAQAAGVWNRREDRTARDLAAQRQWLKLAAAGGAIPDLAVLRSAVSAGDIPRRLHLPPRPDPKATLLLQASDLDSALRSVAALIYAANHAAFRLVVLAPPDAKDGLRSRLDGVEVIGARPDEDPFAAAGALLAGAGEGPVMLVELGLEPVAGWLDACLATFDGFAGVQAVGCKVVAADGTLERAGGLELASGPQWIGAGGSPRDPAFGYVRQVDFAAPVMLSEQLWRERCGSGQEVGEAPASAAEERILYCPTAEWWRMPAPAGAARLSWPDAPPDRDPPARPDLPRILFIDQEAPTVDMDAGGYASFQEMRLLQAAGCRVDFFPKNLAWMDRHTLAMQQAGIRCHHAPFVRDFDGFLRDAAQTYDAIFVVRYKVALLVQEALEAMERRPRLILNLADLHFLRETREAEAGTPGYTLERAEATRAAELKAIAGADLTLTYSPVEAAVIAEHLQDRARVGRAPWTVETLPRPAGVDETDGLLFLGGFGHPPNAEAARVFVQEVMPRLTETLPQARLRIVGSKPTPEVLALAGPRVEVLGYVADLDEVFARSRVFVAPLLAGAGLKGKVVEAMSRGLPTVLTSVAAEATGLTDGVDCLIADSAQAQAEAIARLYADPALWTRMAQAVLETSRRQFGFDQGVTAMRAALAEVGIAPPPGPHLHYMHSRPGPVHGASAAPAVLRLP